MRWLVPFLLLAACSPAAPTEYPPQVEYNFMRACQAGDGGAGEICPCTWAKIEENVPPADLLAFERLPADQRAAHPLQAQLEGYARECAVALQGTAAPAPR